MKDFEPLTKREAQILEICNNKFAKYEKTIDWIELKIKEIEERIHRMCKNKR